MSGYSVTNYNPYNVNNIFAFRGVTNPTPQNKNVPQITQQPDTVSFSTKNKKEGLSNGAKWGLSALAVAGVTTLACVLTKGKVSSKQSKQLVEHIEFKEAKTMEEAKKFAKEKLGVNIDCNLPVDVLNYTNEALCKLKNKTPKDFNIKWIESNPIGGGYGESGFAQVVWIKKLTHYDYGINLSSNYVKNVDKFITEFINGEIERKALVDINGKLQYNNFYAKADISREIAELANKFRTNSSLLSFKDKVKLHFGMADIGESMDKLFIQHGGDVNKLSDSIKIISNPFRPIFHEEGHILHAMNITKKKFDLYDNIKILKQKGLDTSIAEEFQNKYQSIADNVSEYAKTSAAEFVAEVYAKILSGAKFDKEVMSLYAKYGGKPI